ncbi:DNA alkylation repair protein [Basfia succiniciproducens]|uniref:3-methyladenine DNA glycosylase AlkD n=1 Tax=Basfia succiniciproducens TaxID=653940 RepID=A0A1G5E8Q3_9PAST|nr:DNA alkylation repair protein [Basfia succiniciproducens]QIM69282.1 DNA alkylation repair protein [Basfia succiniciproducens]SCY23394.1 3-methyladenine DNA glycosylase AlkD [Basfia succiniciproducens]
MLEQLIAQLYQQKNAQQAVQMAAYMKDQFPFLGIQTPERKRLCTAYFKQEKAQKRIDWLAVERLWALPEREFQYVATDYLHTMQSFLSEQDLPRLQELVITKSWWDTVDSLDRTIGNICFPSQIIDNTMLAWSKADNIWLRRVAIDHQLLRKEKTKQDLLKQILLNNLNQTEFFINKAMGWILRDYSKTNPDWVRAFLAENEAGLSKLTIREAGKYL